MSPYLTFEDQTRQALSFYGSVFGAEPRLTTGGAFGQTGDAAEKIMHGELEIPGGTLYASDNFSNEPVQRGNACTLMLRGAAAESELLSGWFEALSQGGRVTLPLEPQMWGDQFGALVDKFGVEWSVDIAQG